MLLGNAAAAATTTTTTTVVTIIISENPKGEIQSKCWLCKEYEETIDHLTSGCPILTKNEYIIRHDKVCTHLHYSTWKKLGIETTENCYSHEVMTVLWNGGVQGERFWAIGQL